MSSKARLWNTQAFVVFVLLLSLWCNYIYNHYYYYTLSVYSRWERNTLIFDFYSSQNIIHNDSAILFSK